MWASPDQNLGLLHIVERGFTIVENRPGGEAAETCSHNVKSFTSNNFGSKKTLVQQFCVESVESRMLGQILFDF